MWSSDGLRVTSSAEIPGLGRFYAATRVDSLRAVLSAPAAFVGDAAALTTRRIDYGDHEVQIGGELYAQSDVDPNHIVVGSACLQVAGHLDGTEPGSDGGAFCGDISYRWSERWTIPAGTVLTWQTGGVAGKLHRALELASAPRRRGTRWCFSPPLGCGRQDGLEVCVPPSAVTHVPASGEPPAWMSNPG